MGRRIITDEIEFEVPYGKLAGKTWYEETENCKRILALHGWMDNSGSFDNLIPHIKYDGDLYVVAIDLPGHGKSSQLPPGASYHDMHIVMEIRRFLRELNWVKPNKSASTNNNDQNGGAADQVDQSSRQQKFSIIGHSFGAGLGLCYSSFFPDEVEEIILLDFIKTRTYDIDKFMNGLAQSMDEFIERVPTINSTGAQALYQKHSNGKSDRGQVIVSQEAAIRATIDAHENLGSLTREEALCLLKRSTISVSNPPNSVIYSRDLRLQVMLNLREHMDLNKVLFSRVTCHVISILSRRGLYNQASEFQIGMDEMEQHYRKQAKSFHVQWIDADHFLHMNKSQETASYITKYLKSPANYEVTPV